MKAFFLSDDLTGQGPVWLNILWPLRQVFAESFETTDLAIPPPLPGQNHWIRRARDRRLAASRRHHWQEQVRRVTGEEETLLFVVGASPRNVEWSRLLAPVWDGFSHKALHICEALPPGSLDRAWLEKFDLVTCFCGDLTRDYADATSRPVLFWPAHVDSLRYHSTGAHRPVDMIVVGRRHSEMHLPLHRHFNRVGGDRIYLDFVTRTQGPRPCAEEFELLMATYRKSAAAFCYDASGLPRFEGRSPLTARWLQAWAAGCTVFGRAPTGRGVAELTDWPEAMIELEDDPALAIEQVETILSDSAGMAERRWRNVLETVRRHDTRARLALLLDALGAAHPPGLQRGLEAVDALGERLATSGPGP